MRQLPEAFQSKNIFRNVYFWLAVGGSIFLLYVAFIAFTFLPRSTSEVTNANFTEAENSSTNKKNVSTQTPKKNVSSKGSGKLSGARINLVTNNNSGWVDSDDHKMTIVVKISNLDPAIVSEIIRSGGIEIEIDGEKATIINSEPFQKNGFLTRAKAALSSEIFDKFSSGDTLSVEIKTSLHYGDDSATDIISKRFAKQNKTEVEGVKIAWK
ncbi:hypothetical protein BH10ACI1_BH10ACI1_04120 [soil metagenome]